MNVSITEYGAKVCDQLQTKQIQAAIDAVFLAGGGRVTVPTGIWRCGCIRLRSNVTLYLETGAIIEGSRNPEDYTGYINDTVEPFDIPEAPDEKTCRSAYPFSRWNNAVIRVLYAENVSIIGEKGSYINGMNCFDEIGEENYRGPHAINMWYCKNVYLEGYTIYNSSNWAHAIHNSEDITMKGVTVLGGHDGFDVRTCDRVLVEDCAFHTGDDGIAGFDNYDVTVRNCLFDCACSALRFGGTKVLVENCQGIGPTAYGFRGNLTDEEKRDGLLTGPHCHHRCLNLFLYYCDFRAEIRHTPGDITIRNCDFDYTENLFDLSFDGNHIWCCNRSLSSITFENCKLKGAIFPMHIHGDENEPLSITLKDCTVEVDENKKDIAFATVRNCEKLELENVKILGYENPRIVKYNDFEFVTENSTNLEIIEG